jgi:hypothetical protein
MGDGPAVGKWYGRGTRAISAMKSSSSSQKLEGSDRILPQIARVDR